MNKTEYLWQKFQKRITGNTVLYFLGVTIWSIYEIGEGKGLVHKRLYNNPLLRLFLYRLDE